MRRLAILAVLLGACGARTGIRGAGDASVDAAAPPPENGCTSAVSGATPMRGYCSTRAHFTPYDAPRGPTMGWELPLASDFEPIEMLVDAQGRIYVTIDPVRGDDALVPRVVVVIGADGAPLASHDFSPDSVGNLYLGRDGALRATVGRSPRALVRIDPAGNVTPLSTLPPNVFRFAVASDGSLVASVTDFRSPDHLTRVREDGTVVWTSAPIDDGTCGGCMSDVVLGADDGVVIATFTVDGGTTMRGLDPRDGVFLWQTHVDGLVTEGPAIASDGTIRVVTGVTDATTMVPTTIVTNLAASGGLVWAAHLEGDDYQQTWDQALVIDADGSTFVHTFTSLIALDPHGNERWRTPTPSNLTYDAFVAPNHLFVATVGPIRAFDTLTGVERWHVDGPPPSAGTFYYLSNVALAPHGCLVAAHHGGHLFSACDP